MDRIGLRIIVPSLPDCYNFLGFLYEHFRAVPGTFDDSIERPIENGYQSLHTCVYPVRNISKKPIEFRIRTRRMHREAEYGAAVHGCDKVKPEPLREAAGSAGGRIHS